MNPGAPARPVRVVVPEFLPDRHVQWLEEVAEVVYDPDLYADRPRLLAELGSARAILIRNRTIVDGELLKAAPALEVIGRLGVGLDNIDMDATGSRRVQVIPAYGGNAVSVGEYVMGAILVLSRPVYAMTPSMVAGHWPRQGHAFGREVAGQTLGLVGLGHIAREVAQRAAAFGMRVLAHDPFLPGDHAAWDTAQPVDFDSLMAEADVLSVHVPYSPDTHGLIDAAALGRMKRGAILINTSRGGIVDEPALAEALRSGRLGGAALDVFESEPLGGEAASLFEGIDNLVLTPHLAGNTHESVARIATMTVEAVLEALRTCPPT
ncbi:MAG: hydroxyacid dehydrogenase [Actinomycetota bacterium]